jgi:hypothetical protein
LPPEQEVARSSRAGPTLEDVPPSILRCRGALRFNPLGPFLYDILYVKHQPDELITEPLMQEDATELRRPLELAQEEAAELRRLTDEVRYTLQEYERRLVNGE